MSWLGGLSSLSDHISNLTRDLLTERSEESADVATNPNHHAVRQRELEVLCAAQKAECEHLQEQKASAELQLTRLSAEYRAQLQNKEVEINHLKARQASLQEELLARSANQDCREASHSPLQVHRASGFHSDDVDFGDLLSSQGEVHRLSNEVSRLEAETEHWRLLAQTTAGGNAPSDDELRQLRVTVAELRAQLARELDSRQQELAALQDLHRQQLADIAQRQRLDQAAGHSYAVVEADGTAGVEEEEERVVEAMHELEGLTEEPVSPGTRGSEPPRQVPIVPTEGDKLSKSEHVTMEETNVELVLDQAAHEDEFEDEDKETSQKLFDAERAQWEVQRGCLERKITSLREELELKESEAYRSLDTQIGKLQMALKERDLQLVEAAEQRDFLSVQLEELDRQNNEAMQHMITMKENMGRQLMEAEEQIAQRDTDTEHLRAEAIDLKSHLDKLTEQRNNLARAVAESTQELTIAQDAAAANASMLNKLQMEQKMQSRLKEDEESASALGQEYLKKQEEQSGVCMPERVNNQTRLEVVRLEAELVKVKEFNEELQESLRKMEFEQGTVIDQLVEGKVSGIQGVWTEEEINLEAENPGKSQVGVELKETQDKLLTQAQKYEETINEMVHKHEKENSFLRHEQGRLLKNNEDKDITLVELTGNIEQLEIELCEIREMLMSSVEGQQQLQELVKEKEEALLKLNKRCTSLDNIKEQGNLLLDEVQQLRQTTEEKEKQLRLMKEEKSHLKEEIDRLKGQQNRRTPAVESKTLDVITELEAEITQLNGKTCKLQTDLKQQNQIIEEQKQTSSECEQKLQRQTSMLEQCKTEQNRLVATYEQLIAEKNLELYVLKETLMGSQRPNVLGMSGSFLSLDEVSKQGVEQMDKSEKHDLSKVEVETLMRGIQEKDQEIKLLNAKNLSLRHELNDLMAVHEEVRNLTQSVQQKDEEIWMLQSQVIASTEGTAEMHFQQQVNSLSADRDQVLLVLNDKAQEIASLRSEQHQLMDVIAAKDTALRRALEDNRRLTEGGQGEDMTREAIQNLARLVREKDIENDALTQKCRTLLTVLQGGEDADGRGIGSDLSGSASDGTPVVSEVENSNVTSLHYISLLQECEGLRQQVKKVEEWKQQALTSVHNLQSEAAQLQDEVEELAKRAAGDAVLSTNLQHSYGGLVQGHEEHEEHLRRLRDELTITQRGLAALRTTGQRLIETVEHSLKKPSEGRFYDQDRLVEDAEDGMKSNECKEGNKNERIVKEKECLKSIAGLSESSDSVQVEEIQKLKNALNDAEIALEAAMMEKRTLHAAKAALTSDTEALQVRQDNQVKALREKDLLLKSKSDQIAEHTERLREHVAEGELLRQAIVKLKDRAECFEQDVTQLKEENVRLGQQAHEKEMEFGTLQEANMKLSMLFREREFDAQSAREKALALENLLKEKEQGKAGELNQLLQEMQIKEQQAVAFQQERDQMVVSLKQKQVEVASLQAELKRCGEREHRTQQEVQRLRSHLLEVEETYTREALAAEAREADLRCRLAALQERLDVSSSSLENTSLQATMQVESLQEQLQAMMTKRDEALARLDVAQHQVHQYASSLKNMQGVLEKFQRDEKAMYAAELERLKRDSESSRQESTTLKQCVVDLQERLAEASQALESASRLTETLDLKDEQIVDLQREVQLRQELVDDAHSKLMNLLHNSEGKVDKLLMRNLFMGYLSSARNKRVEVLRLLCGVLGMAKMDVDKLLVNEKGGVTTWVSGLLRGGDSARPISSTPKKSGSESPANSSFSQMFLNFLEMESRPTPQPPTLSFPNLPEQHIPAVNKASRLPGPTLARRPEIHSSPFVAPRSSAAPIFLPSLAGSASSHPLMKPTFENLPTFTPVPASGEATAILKDLLKQ
uniref:thyroid receptor-interacting protein 11 isoform X2 n=1 Tax=Myxine glutinosa TaxID=7769 RepID=UPI00358E1BCD